MAHSKSPVAQSTFLSRAARFYSEFGLWRTAVLFGLHGFGVRGHRAFFRFLAKFFEWRRIHQLKVRINDAEIYVDPTTPWVIREYVLGRYYDSDEIQIVRHSIPSAYLFVDIGANFGAWSFSLYGHFPGVLCIEPNPRCCACLARTIEESGFRNVTLMRAALSDRDGTADLFFEPNHSGDARIYDPGDRGSSNRVTVESCTFDTVIQRFHPGARRFFVKLDAQGAEPGIIRSMERTLEVAEDLILHTEIMDSILQAAGSSAVEYMSVLKEHGFTPVTLELEPRTWEDVAASLGHGRDYCFRMKP